MTAAQILGALLVASPFIVLAVVAVRELGWGALLAIFGGTAMTVAVIYAGMYLLTGGQR
jgi:hypothetical protein